MFQNKNSPSLIDNKLFKGVKELDHNLAINPKNFLNVKEGEIVFQTGEKADALFLVIEGEAKLKIPGNKEAIPIIDYKYKNDFFGEKELLEKTDRKSSAVANTNLLLYKIESDRISSLFTKNRNVRINLYQYKYTTMPLELQEELRQQSNEESEKNINEFTAPEIELTEISKPKIEQPETTEDYFKTNFPKPDLQDELNEETSNENDIPDNENEIIYKENNAEGIDVPIEEEPEIQNNEAENSEKFTWDFLETPKIEEDQEDNAFKFPETTSDENVSEKDEIEPTNFNEPDNNILSRPFAKEEETMSTNEEKSIEQKSQLNSEVFFRIIQSAEMIHSQNSLENVLNTIRMAATTLTDSSEGRVFIQSKKNEADLWTYINDGVYSAVFEIAIANTLAGKCFSENEILNIPSINNEAFYNVSAERTEDFVVENMLCYPMTAKGGEVIGVIQLFNNAKGNFIESDEEILSLLSVSAANVILNFMSKNSEYIEAGQLESLSIISRFLHEDLTRPLNSIKEYTELLKGKDQNTIFDPVLELISNQAQTGLESIKTTLEYAEGKLQFKMNEENSTEAFNEILSLLAEFVESKNIRIFKKFEDEARIKTDRAKLYQAFLQITKNACDAMPEGGSIYIIVKRAEEMLMVEIKDSGIGIPESIMPDIYEPFISHGKENKSGLGLTIAKQIIEKHNGSIYIESEIGKGTIVKVSLPIY